MSTDSLDLLRDALLDHVLTAPDISLVKHAITVAETVDGVSLDGLEMANEDTGEDNHRAVQSADRDLDQAKTAMRELASDVRVTVLASPFEKAVSLAHSMGVTFDEWSPERWLDAFAEAASDHYGEAMRTVMDHAAPGDALRWFQAINDKAPHMAVLGDLWRTTLDRPGERDAETVSRVGQLIEAYLADDTVPEPRNARAKDDVTSSVHEVKLNALRKSAFSAYYNQNSSALRHHMWQHHGLGPEGPKWDIVIDRIVTEIARHNRGQREFRFEPLAEDAYPSVTGWMTRLTDTGHLDSWLNRPEQWAPVDPPPRNASGVIAPTHVTAWMKEHVTHGTFTWSVLVVGLEAMNQAGLAQEFKRLGERWSLAHEAQLMASENTPLARERARL